jgi:hypothetical protein
MKALMNINRVITVGNQNLIANKDLLVNPLDRKYANFCDIRIKKGEELWGDINRYVLRNEEYTGIIWQWLKKYIFPNTTGTLNIEILWEDKRTVTWVEIKDGKTKETDFDGNLIDRIYISNGEASIIITDSVLSRTTIKE